MLTLYDAPRCPYCARVRIALAEKHVPCERVEIDLADRPDWIYEKNATGRVPVLEEDAWTLAESAVILEFLEERHPDPPLLAGDAADRATMRLLVHRFDLNLGDAYYAYRRGEPGADERLAGCLGAIDAASAAWPHGYGLVDVAYLPWLIRLRDMLRFDLGPYPAVRERLERLAERPAVAAEIEIVAQL